ncbi:MAG: hypothetical protein VCD31_17610, partial [Alphaproteobacteria bacterium]
CSGPWSGCESAHMSNKAWIEKRKNVVLMVRIFLAVSIVLLLLDLVIHRHDLFSWEGWFGFYGFYGFVACVALVLAAKVLRKLVMRREDYYD